MEGISTAMVTRDADFTVDELPPGFRFHPTDGEVIDHYLKKKVLQKNFNPRAIGEVDLNKCEPWDLPSKAKMGENEWYFYYKKDRKYPTGLRTNRATKAGYWKATGKDKPIYKGKCNLIGMKKTLVFYKGRAPRGEKTNWVMHEFRLQSGKPTYTPNISQNQKPEWVVCRIFHKNTDTILKKSDSLTMIKKSTATTTSSSPSPLPSTMGYNFDNTVLPQILDISPSYPTTNINNRSDVYNSGCIDYSMPFCSAGVINNIQNQQYPNTTIFTTPYCNNLSFTNPQLTDIDISSPAQYVGTPTEIKPQPTVLPPISSTSTNNLTAVKQYMEEEEEKDVLLCFNDLSSLISYPELEIISPEDLLNYVESNNKWPGEIG